jgi:hypothetical protein
VNAFLQHALQAWQPLRQRGMLVDGVCRRPAASPAAVAKPHPRRLLLALTGLRLNPLSRKS